MLKYKAFTFFYIAYYAYFAYIIAFLALRAKDLGLTDSELSVSSGLVGLGLMLSPTIFQYLGDMNYSRVELAKYGTALTFLFFSLHLLVEMPWLSIIFCALGAFCARGSLCLVDGVVVNTESVNFEFIRGLGSLSFILSVLTLGYIFERWSSFYGALLVLCFLFGLLCAARGLYFPLIGECSKSRLFPVKEIFPLLLVCFVGWLPQGAAIAYLSVYLDSLGWSKFLIGLTWGFSVLCEVGLFFYFRKLLEHISLVSVLKWCLFLGGVRWCLVGVLSDTTLLFLVQGFQAFSFAGVYIASMKLVSKLVEENYWQVGMGWLTTFGIAPGMILGSLSAGYLLNFFSLDVVFIIFGIISMFGVSLTFLIKPKKAAALKN